MHPAKSALFLEKLTRIKKRSRKINFSKKLFKTLAREKRIVTFAPANREVDALKRQEHVPRHIELTAVPKEISEQI